MTKVLSLANGSEESKEEWTKSEEKRLMNPITGRKKFFCTVNGDPTLVVFTS